MYKIIFIDECQDDIDDFLDYVEGQEKFTVISKFPTKNIDDLVDDIFSQHIDAVVTDFLLNEIKENISYNVPYTGVDLVDKIRARKKDFPCFVITSFDDDAVKESYDVNLVYVKDILHGLEEKSEVKSNFIDRIFTQIEHYKARIKDAGKELEKLIEKSRKQSLNAKEEDRLTELDDFLEKAIDKPSNIPARLKKQSTLNDLHKLIENTDELLRQLDKNG